MKLLTRALVLLLASAAAIAQIGPGQLPPATLPLTGTEQVPMQQGQFTVQAPASAFSAASAPNTPTFILKDATGVGSLANYRLLQGTANQVILTDGGALGNLNLSLPQSIALTSAPTFGAMTLSSAGPTLDIKNTGAPANARWTRLRADTVGGFTIVPVTDAGVVSSLSFFSLPSASGEFTGFQYKDSTGEFFSFSGNDFTVTANPNSQPLYIINDFGTTGALAGLNIGAGTAGNLAPGYFTCVGGASTLGAQLTGGPTTNNCSLSTGNQLFGITGTASLSLGTKGIEAMRIFGADQGVIVGNPTGGDKGAGTLNATGLFVNGTAVTTGTSVTYNGVTVALGGSGTLNLASSNFANQGTATTVLHGNAAGNPSFAQVANADMVNSSVTLNGASLSLGGTRTLTLASADYANQGTTTTLLHGNAAGNPSFGQVVLTTDVTGVLPAANGGVAFANPTATVSTAAVNGVATTSMRSDAAPAIDLTMSPTWTGGHTFSQAGPATPVIVTVSTGGVGNVALRNTGTAAGDFSQLALTSQNGATGLTLMSANANTTAASTVTGGPAGAQGVIKTTTTAPLVFGVNAAFAGWVESGGFVTAMQKCSTACSATTIKIGETYIVVKGSSTSRNTTTTLTADPDMQFTSVPTGVYMLQMSLHFNSVAAGGAKAQVAIGGGLGNEVTGTSNCNGTLTLVGMAVAAAPGCTNVTFDLNSDPVQVTVSVSGTLSINWAQNVSNASNSSLVSSSTLQITRLL